MQNIKGNQEEVQHTTDISSSSTIFTPSINPNLTSDPNLKISYDWQFDNGTPSTSSDATSTVTWAGKTLTAEANSASSIGSCSTTLYMYLIANQDVCMSEAESIDTVIDAGSFTLPDGSTPTSYQWQSSKNGATWADIAENGTSSSYTISSPPRKRNITYYRVLMDGEASEPAKVRLRSCLLPVNHNISVMGYYD